MAIYLQQSLGKQEVNKSREKEGFHQILQALATKRFKALRAENAGEDKCHLLIKMICDLKPRVQTSIQARLPLKATRPLNQLSNTAWICRIYLKKQTGATESNLKIATIP